MDKSSFIFCIASLGVCLAIAILAYPFATMSSAELAISRTAVDAEELDDIEIRNIGKVSVAELLTNYIENPPEVAPAGSAGATHFQGC